MEKEDHLNLTCTDDGHCIVATTVELRVRQLNSGTNRMNGTTEQNSQEQRNLHTVV